MTLPEDTIPEAATTDAPSDPVLLYSRVPLPLKGVLDLLDGARTHLFIAGHDVVPFRGQVLYLDGTPVMAFVNGMRMIERSDEAFGGLTPDQTGYDSPEAIWAVLDGCRAQDGKLPADTLIAIQVQALCYPKATPLLQEVVELTLEGGVRGGGQIRTSLPVELVFAWMGPALREAVQGRSCRVLLEWQRLADGTLHDVRRVLEEGEEVERKWHAKWSDWTAGEPPKDVTVWTVRETEEGEPSGEGSDPKEGP